MMSLLPCTSRIRIKIRIVVNKYDLRQSRVVFRSGFRPRSCTTSLSQQAWPYRADADALVARVIARFAVLSLSLARQGDIVGQSSCGPIRFALSSLILEQSHGTGSSHSPTQ